MISKKEQIINTAAKLFRAKGFTATSMQDIAEGLDIKAASLYNHIQSKNEILEIILLQVAHAFVSGMHHIKSSSLSAPKKIEKLIGLHVQLTVKHTDHMAMLIGDWTHLNKEAKKKYIELRDQYEDDFRSIILDCVQSGFYKDINIEVSLFSILSTLRWTYSWYSKHTDISQFDLEHYLYISLIEGLLVKSA